MASTVQNLDDLIDIDLRDDLGEKALYIDDHHPDRRLFLDIKNIGSGLLEILSPYRKQASSENYHFALTFEAGILSPLSQKELTVSTEGWDSLFEDDTLYILCTEARDLSPEKPEYLEIKNITVAGSFGAKHSSVDISYRLHPEGEDDNEGEFSPDIKVLDLRGRPETILHVGIAGSSSVINNGAPNSLKLRITNLSRSETLILKGKDSYAPGIFRITIPVQPKGGPLRDWALGSESQMQVVRVTTNDTKWEVNSYKNGLNPYWEITTANESAELAPSESIELLLDNIITVQPSGHAHIYLKCENVHGFRDSSFVLNVQRGPIFYQDTETEDGALRSNVGIGTNTPQASLSIHGATLRVDHEDTEDGKKIGWMSEWSPNNLAVKLGAYEWGQSGEAKNGKGLRIEGENIELAPTARNSGISLQIFHSALKYGSPQQEKTTDIMFFGKLRVNHRLIREGPPHEYASDLSVMDEQVGIRTEQFKGALTVRGRACFTGEDEKGMPALVVTEDKKVGIGTDNPQATLHVNGDAKIEANLHVNNSINNLDIIPQQNGCSINVADSGYPLIRIHKVSGSNEYVINVGPIGSEMRGTKTLLNLNASEVRIENDLNVKGKTYVTGTINYKPE